jgi:hypothetical protein
MPARQPRYLPFASLGDLFKGRETALAELRAALMSGKGAAVTRHAVHGPARRGSRSNTRCAMRWTIPRCCFCAPMIRRP